VLGLLYRVFASFPKNEVVDDKSIQFRWGSLHLTVQKKGYSTSSCGATSLVEVRHFAKCLAKSSSNDNFVIICVKSVRSQEKPYFPAICYFF
jgi:hypothetical protein